MLGAVHLVLDPPAEKGIAHDLAVRLPERTKVTKSVQKLAVACRELASDSLLHDWVHRPLGAIASITRQFARGLDLFDLEIFG